MKRLLMYFLTPVVIGSTTIHGFPQATVSTYAGSGTAGLLNGSATSAQFDNPYSVVADAAGNVYVADKTNHVVRVISTTGTVSTFAGNGSVGFADGMGTAATFNSPSGLAIDNSGNIYVADRLNHAIRIIDPGGVVSTIAGTGSAGYTNGLGSTAQFNSPFGICIDDNNNVLVADAFNNVIRMISTSGVVSTVAGSTTAGYQDGAASSAQFRSPTDVDVDLSGNIVVADQQNHCIRLINPGTNYVTTISGNPSAGYLDGAASSAKFNLPNWVTMDYQGNIYVSDAGNYRVRKIGTDLNVYTIAGSGVNGFNDGAATSAAFGLLMDIFFREEAGTGVIYLADRDNNRIRKITGLPTGIHPDHFTPEVNLFPVPVEGPVWLQVNLSQTSKSGLALIDALGRTLEVASLDLITGTNLQDISSLFRNKMPGTYFLRVMINGENVVKTCIISNR